MAVIFCDGFDSYSAATDAGKKWAGAASAWAYGAAKGRNGNGGISGAAGSVAGLLSPAIFGSGGANTGIFHFGFYIKISAIPSARVDYLQLLTVANATSGQIQINASGTISFQSTNAGFVGSGTKNICDNNWHWVEIKINFANAANTLALWVDSVLDFSISVNFIGVGAINQMQFVTNNNAATINGLDDVIVYDNNGQSPVDADFPLGPREIVTLRPTSDSAVQFTPSGGGGNFAQVNETAPDGDTSYVEDLVVGHKDIYSYGQMTGNPNVINGIVANAYVENPNAGALSSFFQLCKSNATEQDGTAITLPGSYTTKQQYFGLDPDGNIAWTKTKLNSALIGFGI